MRERAPDLADLAARVGEMLDIFTPAAQRVLFHLFSQKQILINKTRRGFSQRNRNRCTGSNHYR